MVPQAAVERTETIMSDDVLHPLMVDIVNVFSDMVDLSASPLPDYRTWYRSPDVPVRAVVASGQGRIPGRYDDEEHASAPAWVFQTCIAAGLSIVFDELLLLLVQPVYDFCQAHLQCDTLSPAKSEEPESAFSFVPLDIVTQ
jgi:hypothetical protein